LRCRCDALRSVAAAGDGELCVWLCRHSTHRRQTTGFLNSKHRRACCRSQRQTRQLFILHHFPYHLSCFHTTPPPSSSPISPSPYLSASSQSSLTAHHTSQTPNDVSTRPPIRNGRHILRQLRARVPQPPGQQQRQQHEEQRGQL
jgi:hypothetical protein